MFLGDTFVVSARKGGQHAQGSARASLEARPDLCEHGVSAVLLTILGQLYRAVHPMLGPLEAIERGAYPRLAPMRPYLRDVADDAKLLHEDVIGQRDRLTAVLEASLALIAHRQNNSIRKISGWAAIIAVPTLIAGVYGMNFSDLPGSSSHGGFVVCVVSMLLAAAPQITRPWRTVFSVTTRGSTKCSR